jgi:hypothetical protein
LRPILYSYRKAWRSDGCIEPQVKGPSGERCGVLRRWWRQRGVKKPPVISQRPTLFRVCGLDKGKSLSSGEGLIYAMRDPRMGEDAEGNPMIIDAGAEDERLMVVEGEFAGPLRAMTREGNTLSVLIRQGWDGGKLATLTKSSPLKATDAHISVIGHIIRTELVRLLSETDAHNGFANRHLWLLVRRSKDLPFGDNWNTDDAALPVQRIKDAVEFGGNTARSVGATVPVNPGPRSTKSSRRTSRVCSGPSPRGPRLRS